MEGEWFDLATDLEEAYGGTPGVLTLTPAPYLPPGSAEVFVGSGRPDGPPAGTPDGYAVPVNASHTSAPGEVVVVHGGRDCPVMLLRVTRDPAGAPLALDGIALSPFWALDDRCDVVREAVPRFDALVESGNAPA